MYELSVEELTNIEGEGIVGVIGGGLIIAGSIMSGGGALVVGAGILGGVTTIIGAL